MAHLDEILKIVNIIYMIFPSALLTLISLYFCYKKMFHKIEITFSEVHSGFSRPRISNIIMYNKKDRVEIIRRLSIVINKEIKYEIIKFDSPLIIHPLECIKIDTPELSEYYLDNKPIEFPSLIFDNNFFFELYTNEKPIIVRPKKIAWKKKKKRYYKEITTMTKYYNGIVIDDSVLFSIVYIRNNIHKTAFVDKNGMIRGEWDFNFNHIPKDVLNDKDKLLDIILNSGIKYNVENLIINKVEKSLPLD